MIYDEEKGELKPASFQERVKENFPDAFYVVLTVLAFSVAIYGNKNNNVASNDVPEQTTQQIQNIKQINTVLYNDSIKQKIH